MEDVGWGVLLVDARNLFKKINFTTMIWHVRNNWKTSGRFCFNTYWHWKVLELRGNELTVHPKEGVTQGGPLDVIIYGLGVLTLI